MSERRVSQSLHVSSKVAMLLLIPILAVTLPTDSRAKDCLIGAVDTMGVSGSEPGEFQGPAGIGQHLQYNGIYVADSGNHRIQKFEVFGAFLSTWGSLGTGEGEFDTPTDVEVGVDGHVYVVDSGNHRIQVFTLEGGFLREWGSEGSGEGQFLNPTFICVDDTTAYVSDTGNHRVQKFNTAGTFLGAWGTQGSGDGQFMDPTGLDTGYDGLYVADRVLCRVQVFNLDGEYQKQFGSPGSELGQLSGPMGLKVVEGSAHIADMGNHRIVILGDDYRCVWVFREDLGVASFYDVIAPYWRDAWGTDFENNRLIQFFQFTPVQPTTWGRIKAKYRSGP
jgi:hypothetical protein